MEPTSLYLHIPFCKHRCAYCDFNTYAGLESLIPDYVEAVCREVEWLVLSYQERIPVHTIYFGGGTPSLLSLKEIDKIFKAIRDGFLLRENVEITIEANPGTLSRGYLQGMIDLGVNRLSIGMQSAHAGELNLLDRSSSYEDVVNSVTWARTVGINNINLDLIYGIPAQTLIDWRRSLQLALDLRPAHFSLYPLTLDEDVLMHRWIQRGLLPGQDADLEAEMYELADMMLESAGYESYEISNWARHDRAGQIQACQHNMQYWSGKPYLGLGAGAHGYINQIRTVNVLKPHDYINQLQDEVNSGKFKFPISPATMEYKYIGTEEEIGEYMMVGLRLTRQGISETDFLERFGRSIESVYSSEVNRFIETGLLEWVNEPKRRLRLTKRGRLLGNQVFCEFI